MSRFKKKCELYKKVIFSLFLLFFLPNINISGVDCSHRRSILYFLHSIFEPKLFPSRECLDVAACSKKETISKDVGSYMGEISQVKSQYISSLISIFYIMVIIKEYIKFIYIKNISKIYISIKNALFIKQGQKLSIRMYARV